MKYLITGGAGYIGSVLANVLLNAGHYVCVYDNLMYQQESLVPICCDAKLEFIHDDVRNQDNLNKHIQKADVIIPLAAIVGAPACEKNKELATQIIYEQIKFIVSNISKSQQLILPNTNSGYGVNDKGICIEESPLTPISHYGVEKVRAEQYLLDGGNGISLRLATVFGVSPRMRLDLLVNDFTYKAYRDGYIVLFEKDFKRNFIHIRDVVSAFLFMSQNYKKTNNQIFNVGLSNANISKWELCQKIKHFIPKFSIQVDEISKDPDQRNYIVSNEKIESLGWRAEFSIDDGIQELLKAYIMILNKQNRANTNL